MEINGGGGKGGGRNVVGRAEKGREVEEDGRREGRKEGRKKGRWEEGK